MSKKGKAKKDLEYAHNPHYAMIVPDPKDPDEDIASTGQS